MENWFDDIGAAIINSGEGVDLDQMDESRKRTYRETLGGDDDVMDKSIYVFSNRLGILKQKLIGDTSMSANDTTQSDVMDPISSSIRRMYIFAL